MYAAEMAKREQVRKAHRVHAARKQRERRRTALILLVTLISIFIIGVGFGTMLAKAQEPEKSTSEKYYRSICVEKGDTLWDIASEYMDSVYYASHAEYMKDDQRDQPYFSDRSDYFRTDTGPSLLCGRY